MKIQIKRVLVLVIMLGMFFSLAPQSSEAATNYTATVNADVLNVREKPSTTSKKVGTLKKGNKITVYLKLKSGWSQIKYKNKTAYVSTKYLKFEKPPTSYLHNKNKIYVYKRSDIGLYTFKPSKQKYMEWNVWEFIYKNETTLVIEKENKEGYIYGYPNSEAFLGIKYPVKVGQKWSVGYEGDETINRITSTNKTVKVKAGTFKNVIEIVDQDGVKTYYAPNVGLIKSTGKYGTELIQIKNK